MMKPKVGRSVGLTFPSALRCREQQPRPAPLINQPLFFNTHSSTTMGSHHSTPQTSSTTKCEKGSPTNSVDDLGGNIDPSSTNPNSRTVVPPRPLMPQVMRPETFEERLYRKVCVFDVGVVDGVVDWRLSRVPLMTHSNVLYYVLHYTFFSSIHKSITRQLMARQHTTNYLYNKTLSSKQNP